MHIKISISSEVPNTRNHIPESTKYRTKTEFPTEWREIHLLHGVKVQRLGSFAEGADIP